MKKERVDVLLVKQGLFETREQAKRAVMAGEILGENEERLDKPGEKIDPSVKLHFKGKKMPGQMGNKRVTIQNLEIVQVDADKNLILVKGAVPGPKKSLVTLKEAVKAAV